jgi:hypothetical protein
MREAMADRQSSSIDLVAEAACCPGAACGPIFETPLVEQVFERIRAFAGRAIATRAVEVPSGPNLDHVRSAGSSVPPGTARPQEVASDD